VDKNLIVQGGQQHKSQGIFECFSLNPIVLNTDTHTWFEPRVALGKGPENRAYHTATRVGTSLFIFGGSAAATKKGAEAERLGDMPIFDLVRMAWETRDVRGRRPKARCMHTAALHEGKLFIAGGFDGTVSLGDVHVLDTDSLLWSQPKCQGSVPPCLQAHCCTVVGSRLFMLGGMTVRLDDLGHTFVEYNSDVHCLDTADMTWDRLRRRGSTPSARAYATVSAVEGHLLLLGGWGGKVEPLDALPALDLNGLGAWATVGVPGTAPAGVYGHSATLIGSNVVIFGGWDGVSPLNSVNVLDLTALD